MTDGTAMFDLVRYYVGLPLVVPLAASGSDIPPPDGRAPTRSSATCCCDRVARHADSQFGRDHHFGEIRTPADFRRRVPIRGYEGLRALHRPRPPGGPRRPVRRGDRGPDVRHDVGDDQPAQDDSGDPRVAARLPRGLDDLGHPRLRRPLRDPRIRAAADPPARQRLARTVHSLRHPLRRDHRADGPHAEPAGPVHLLHAPRRARGSRTSRRSITWHCGSRSTAISAPRSRPTQARSWRLPGWATARRRP